MANKRKLENLAFPAISTGVYGYPAEEAAEVRVQSSRHFGWCRWALQSTGLRQTDVLGFHL
jgi:O-acetyl-ADP-ribose deacetylase (regulator of RNase III)